MVGEENDYKDYKDWWGGGAIINYFFSLPTASQFVIRYK